MRKLELSELRAMVSITSNSSILALKFRVGRMGTMAPNIKTVEDETNRDIILETYRRSEFIVFLLSHSELNSRPKPEILTANCFRVDNSQIVDFEI